MKFLLAILIIVLICMWRQLVHQKKEHNNIKSDLQKTIEQQKRELDFYKNIKEDSGKLNATDDKSTNKLIEQATQEVLSSRKEQNHSSSSSQPTKKIASLLDNEQSLACDKMEQSNHNFFITGKAGTGKSFLLDVFRRTTSKKHIVLAPTGIAALNVNGVTLHSAFGYYNLVNLDIDSISLDTIRLKSEKQLLLKEVSTIIIDEISMVRADTFEKIDKILRAITKKDLSFGGKQIILFGDLFQLPPIAKNEELLFLLNRFGGKHFFLSNAYKQGDFNFLELTINHRQEADSAYFELLNRVRDGSFTDADITMLNKRVDESSTIFDRYTTLLPKKGDVEYINNQRIANLPTQEYKYSAYTIMDKYPDKKKQIENIFPILNLLSLKKGALVMMVANDPEHRWVNGTLGIVNDLSNDNISVAINGQAYDIHPFEFSEQEATYSEEDKKIKYEDILTVVQYPIIPAYAITIHKSQGQTYQNISCDLQGVFADGQTYVALSRCASLDGLHLKTPINKTLIHVDKDVLNFYRGQNLK